MVKFLRITVLVGTLSLLAACDKGPSSGQVEFQPSLSEYFGEPRADMNVLVISFDTLRADALGVYGFNRPVSPNIDAWAQQSLVLDRAWSSAQATPTSFAGAWTGMYPFRVFRGWNLTDQETLAQVFASAGYKTVGLTDNQQLMVERGFAVGFDDYQLLESGDDDELLALSLDWLENNHQQTFFGWFHFLSPHTPYTWREMSKQFYEEGYEGRFQKTTKGRFEVNSEAELKRVRDLYDGEIFYADSLFQQILDKLSELGIADKTIVVLTSDHGEEFMDHGGLQHDSVYEEIIRVPLIIYHPDLKVGARSDLPYSNVDLYRSLPALVGITTDKVVDGINFLEPVPLHRTVIATAMTDKLRREFGLVQGDDKYHLDCSPEFAERLFNLVSDPGEKQSLALDNPKKLEHMYEALELVTGGDPCKVIRAAVSGESVESNLTDEQLEQLKSLGYIQ